MRNRLTPFPKKLQCFDKSKQNGSFSHIQSKHLFTKNKFIKYNLTFIVSAPFVNKYMSERICLIHLSKL